MGLHFGNLGKVFGKVTHTYSPYELNPLKGIWTVKRFRNTARRFGDNVPFMAPPFLMGYLAYVWAEEENHRLHRKNPADFENDK